jgi:hypothetical protein
MLQKQVFAISKFRSSAYTKTTAIFWWKGVAIVTQITV